MRLQTLHPDGVIALVKGRRKILHCFCGALTPVVCDQCSRPVCSDHMGAVDGQDRCELHGGNHDKPKSARERKLAPPSPAREICCDEHEYAGPAPCPWCDNGEEHCESLELTLE